LGQSEHVKVLEGDVDALGRGQLARDAEDRRDEVEADDPIPCRARSRAS